MGENEKQGSVNFLGLPLSGSLSFLPIRGVLAVLQADDQVTAAWCGRVGQQ